MLTPPSMMLGISGLVILLEGRFVGLVAILSAAGLWYFVYHRLLLRGRPGRGHLAQYRPCALDAGPLADVATWAEQYRPVWEARLDRMADYLTHLRSQRMTEGHDD